MLETQIFDVILMIDGKISLQCKWIAYNPFRALDYVTDYAYRYNILWNYAYTEVVSHNKIKSYSKRITGATFEYRIETRDIR